MADLLFTACVSVHYSVGRLSLVSQNLRYCWLREVSVCLEGEKMHRKKALMYYRIVAIHVLVAKNGHLLYVFS